MKYLMIPFTLALLSSIAIAEVNPCDSAVNFNRAKAAKAYNRTKIFSMEGVNGVDVQDCDANYLAKKLGKVTPAVAVNTCGIYVLFDTEKDELSFAKWADKNLAKGKFPVSANDEEAVGFCGGVIGEIEPQPGVTIGN